MTSSRALYCAAAQLPQNCRETSSAAPSCMWCPPCSKKWIRKWSLVFSAERALDLSMVAGREGGPGRVVPCAKQCDHLSLNAAQGPVGLVEAIQALPRALQ